MAKQLNVNLNFTADTRQAENNLASLKQQLETLAAQGNILGPSKMNDGLAKAVQSAKDLSQHLNNAYNPKTGNLSLTKFDESLKRSHQNLLKLSDDLLGAGKTGQQAFMNLQNGIAAANVQLNKAQTLLGTFATTFMNTLRWQATSSIIHGISGALSQAMGYSKDLNKTLTDIRIVAPEKSLEDMAKFAKIANQNAKELSSTTLDYAKAALIYYQQGEKNLGGEQAIIERTNVTTKMANVTGDSVDEVSSYMTSIWNNFNKAGDESVEHYADILTKLGAETAASTTEITTALEKYTGVASTIGLSYESATAAATTLIDRMRETPEVAGTALKTIFARMEGLKLNGEVTDEDGVTTDLNKYSEALHMIGVEIKDQNGDMRQADEILMDMGEKWQGLSQDQKIATAETVAGIRQWQQFSALMDNFDYFKQYKDMAEFGSEGALQEQQDIYAESWEAASNRVKTAWESIYASIFDDKAFIKMTNAFGQIIEAIKITTDTMGGMKGVILLISALMFKVFNGNITTALEAGVQRINNAFRTTVGAVSSLEGGFQKLSAQHFVSLYNEVNKGTHSIQQQSQEVLQYAQTVENVPKYFQTWAQELEKTNKLTAQMNALGRHVSGSERAQLEAEIAYTNQLVESNVQLNKNAQLQKERMESISAEAAADSKNEDLIKAKTEANLKLVKIEKELLNLKELSEQTEQGEVDVYSRRISELEKMAESEKGLTELEETELNILREIEENEGKVTEIIARRRSIIKDGFKDYEKVNNAQREFVNLQKEAEVGAARVAQQQDNIAKRIGDIAQRSSTLKGLVPGMVSGLSSAALSLSMIHSAIETIKSPDASGFEKFVSATMAASFAMGTLREAYMGLQGIMKAQLILQDQEIAKTIASNIVNGAAMSCEEAAAAAKAGKVLATEALTAAEVEETLTSAINGTITWEEAAAHLGCADAKQLEAVATGALSAANKGLLKSALAVLGPMAALVAIAGALAFVGYNAYKSLSYNQDKLDELSKSSETTATAFDNLKSKTDEIGSALDEWGNKINTLQELEYGTAKWTRALGEANSQARDIIDSVNEMNDSLGSVSSRDLGNNNLTELNRRLKDQGFEEGTNAMNLISGEDYFINSEGAYEFTEIGNAKIAAINDMVIDQAQIIAHGAEIMTDKQEEILDKEQFMKAYGNELAGDVTKSKPGGYYVDENGSLMYNAVGEKETEYDPGQIFDDIVAKALTDRNFDITDLGKDEATGQVSNFLQKMINEDVIDQTTANKIAESTDLQNALLQHVTMIKDHVENIEQDAQQDILANDEVRDKIFGEKSSLSEEDQKKYGTGITERMGEDVAIGTQRYLSGEGSKSMEDLYKEINANATSATDLKDWYADQVGIEKGSEEYEAIDEDTIDSAVAYQAALDDVNKRVQDYIDLVEDSKRDNEALAKVGELYKKNAENIDDAANALQEEYTALKGVEKGVKRTNAAWDSLTSDQKKALKQFSKEASGYLSEALDLPKDSVLDPKFVGRNLDLIKDAIDGDTEAISELQKKLSNWNAHHLKDVADELDIDIDTSQVQGEVNELNDLIQDGLLDDYEVGVAIDDTDFCANVASMTNDLLQMGYDAETAGDMISSALGGSVEIVGYQNIPINDSTNSDASGTTTTTISGEYVGKLDSEGNPVYKTYETEAEAKTALSKMDNADSYITVPIFGKTKNVPAGTGASQGGGRRGGGGGGGGGGRRGGRRARAAKRQQKESKIDRYHDVTNKIEKTNRAAEKLKETQEQLYGKKRLDNMDKVNQKLKEELKYINEKNERTRKFLALDRKYLQQELKAQAAILKKSKGKTSLAASNFTFDQSGRITNYNTIMDPLQEKLDKLYDQMNDTSKYKTEEAQNNFKEKYITPIEEAIDAIQGMVDAYEETYEEMLNQLDEWNDKYNEILENNYEKVTYQVELDTTINENSRKLLEYYTDQVQDNVYKLGELFSLYFGENGQLEQIGKEIGVYTDKKYQDIISGEQVDYLTHIVDLYTAGAITQANYVEGLQEAYDAMLDNLDALSSLKDEMEDYYSDVLSQAQEEIDKYTQSIDYAREALEHWQNILELTNDGKQYDQLIMIQQQLRDNAEVAYNNSVAQYQEILKNIQEFKDANISLLPTYTDEQKQKYYDELNSMIAAAEDAGDQVMEDYENLIDSAQALLEIQVERANKTVDELLSGISGGFEELTRIMDLTSTGQDEYLTKTNQIYEMNKMLGDLRADMDKTENKSAKQRLNNFAKEIEQLRDKDELSQLELDIAQARYKQLQAQIALEEAQNAKQIIRLSRDNEGNYGYVYTANEDKVNDARQALEDASNDLYNIYLQGNNDYNEKIINYAQQMLDEIQEINDNPDLSQEERERRIEKIREQYGGLIGDATDLMNIARDGLTNEFNAAAEAWTSKYDDNVNSILDNLGDGVDNWLTNLELIKTNFLDLAQKYADQEQKVVDKALEFAEDAQSALTADDGIFSTMFGILDQSVQDLSQYISTDLPDINTKMSNIENAVVDIRDKIALEAGEGADTFFSYNKLMEYLSTSNKNSSYSTALNNLGGRYLIDSNKNSVFTSPAQNIANNATAETILQNIYGNAWHGVISYDKDGNLMVEYSSDGQTSKDVYKKLKDKIKNSSNWEKGAPLLEFESGGYTGDWSNDTGKLALLHSKELVLNEQDTQNLLTSVDIIRSIVDQIDIQALSAALGGAHSASIGHIDNSHSIDQNVTISAEFPNVSSREEIEAAFDNLVNRAAQYSYRQNK